MKRESCASDKLKIERELLSQGFKTIAGVDEVGRGPLAGPVVCAAVVMPLKEIEIIQGVDDSKKLSPKKRELLAKLIRERALAYTVYEVNEKIIDEINILQATRLGMKNALESLKIVPDTVITDGNMTLDISFPQRSIVHGDALSYSIGAASIVAKVFRDALMEEYAKTYPAYGFERNKGYGTAEHIRAIKEHGICPIHRRTFVKKFWAGGEKNSPKST
jgi:ribonuclease HII